MDETVTTEASEGESEPRGKRVRSPDRVVRHWLSELTMERRRTKEWRDEAKKIRQTYEGGTRSPNSFNILWSNTDTLLPAVFNSLPVPDVRRRFRDADPVGKAAGQVIERTLSYELDQFDAAGIASDAVLDMLLVGRGVVRVRFEPVFGQTGDEVLDALTPWEHVQWDDFATGPGKRWADVTWVGFRHDMTRDTVAEKFGEGAAGKLEYRKAEHADERAAGDEKQVFETAEVWEIWDRDERRCVFIAECYKDAPLGEFDDPLALQGFFPLPRPAYAVEQSTSLVPIPLYRLYKEQAAELNRVSRRINKIVEALKVRGAYLGNQNEIKQVIEADDNQMVPVSNLSGVADLGGLDKSIWIMPIDKLIDVLNGLYLAREQIKATIYEITGISDIVRGSTQASESATAQRLKSEWGSMRLQKMQRAIQRLLRDCMRLQAEIYSQTYTQEMFAQMTGLQLPTQQQKAMMQQMVEQQAQQGAMMGQPPAPPPPQLMLPAWEDVMAALRVDVMRASRIDIETDSTIAETLDRDMRGLAEITEAIGQLIAGSAPAVQSGMLPVDAVKEFAITISRRARMGLAVEDALEKIQQPPPMQQVDPEQQKQLEAGKQEIEKGRAEINDGKMAVAEQHREMLQQQLDFVSRQAGDFQKQAMQHQKMATDASAQIAERGPADKVFETLLEQLMNSQAQTQAIVTQAVEAMQTALAVAAEQSQTTSQAVMASLAKNAEVMGQAVAAVTAPREVTVQLPSGKTASARSEIRH